MLKKLSLITAASLSAFAMNSAELNINDKDLEATFSLDLGQVNPNVEPDTTFVNIRAIKGSDDHSTDKNADIKSFYEANFLMIREIKTSGVKVGMGIKANYTGNANDDMFITIPLGLEVRYEIPAEIPVELGANVYYAPESLSLAEANSFLEYRAFVNAEIIENASIVAGYRTINTEYKVNGVKSDLNLNKSAYFGFKFKF